MSAPSALATAARGPRLALGAALGNRHFRALMLWLAGVPILIEYPLRIVVSPFFKPVEWERGCWQRARIHTHVLRLRGRQQRHVSSDRLPVSAVSPLAHATVGQVLLLNIIHWDVPF
jgi:hypothetical protein